MRRRFSKWLLVVLAAGVLGATWSALEMSSYADSPMAQAEEIRDDLREIRRQLNACLATQNRMEARFRSLADQTQWMREEVDRFEAMDPDGVPAQFYDEYLALVEEYNESIPEWERQAEGLQEYAQSCRTLVEVHNQWADSLRQALVEIGVWDESWGAPAAERLDPQAEVEESREAEVEDPVEPADESSDEEREEEEIEDEPEEESDLDGVQGQGPAEPPSME